MNKKFELVLLKDEKPKDHQVVLVLFECTEISKTGIRKTEHPMITMWNGKDFSYSKRDKFDTEWKDALQHYVDTLMKNPKNVTINRDTIKWFKKI